jgi:hypothetical protein
MKAWQKIDKFYPILLGVALLLAVIAIYTFRNIFSVVVESLEVQEVEDAELHIDRQQLDAAEKAVFETEYVPLEVKDDTIIETEEEKDETG